MNTPIQTMLHLHEDLVLAMHNAFPVEPLDRTTYAWNVGLSHGSHGEPAVTVCIVNCGEQFRECPGAFASILLHEAESNHHWLIVKRTIHRLRCDHSRRRADWLGLPIEAEVSE